MHRLADLFIFLTLLTLGLLTVHAVLSTSALASIPAGVAF